MPRSNAVVGNIAHLSRPESRQARGAADVGRGATVALENGETAELVERGSRESRWLTVIDSLRQAGLPVYLEVDPESRTITDVLVPLRVMVEELRDDGDDVEVELWISQARHLVRRTNADFAELVAALEQARAERIPALVTETNDGSEIIDVRLLREEGSDLEKRSVPEEGVTSAPAEGDFRAQGVSLGQAGQMFALANAQTCCSSGPAAPCIPFTFPDDGCWARAHEMSRLMRNAGVLPEKIWIYGSLRVATTNHPSCEVRWGWHVAPILRVDSATGPVVYVIDPSLFTAPVPQATWVGVQGDPGARTVISSADVYHRSYDGSVVYDPTYSDTNTVLTRYRAQLQLRSASSDGPPPYPQCAPRPPGVQWFGTLAANSSRRWFTFGWPAAWHMVWTVMPLSICPGSPQLSWSVAVERANAGQVTYWITVTNLTAQTVRFEGRYDVLAR